MKVLNKIKARIARYLLKRRIKNKCEEAIRFLRYTKLDVPEEEKQVAYMLGVESYEEAQKLLEVYNESA